MVYAIKYILMCHISIDTKFYQLIGPILDDRLDKIPKPWKGALSSHSVCVCVCLCVCLSERGLQVTPFDLGT